MILLQVQQVARHFGAEVLFENIFMEVKENTRIALVGRNGAGKSTLLKMIAGEEEPDEGQLSITKEVTIGYLSQDTSLESDKTIWQEMLFVFKHVRKMEKDMHEIEGKLSDSTIQSNPAQYQEALARYDDLQHAFREANGYGYESEIRSVLHGFRFYEEDYTKQINELSGGQKTRLALARLLLEKKDLLILDEPTNHLDIDTLAWLENYLQTYTGALLIVSHDRYFLDKIATEVYELSRQKLSHYNGNYSAYLKQKAEEIEQQQKIYDKQQKKIEKLEDFVQKNIVRASSTKQAQSRRKQLEKLDRIEKPSGEEKSAHFRFSIERESGNVVLTTEELAIGYEKPLSQQIDLDVRKKEAIALVGPNGVGKTTLLKTIIGHLSPLKGQIKLGTKVDPGYYDQEQQGLNLQKTVLHELWDEHPSIPEKDIRTILGSFLFSGEDVEKNILSLSGGEKARVSLAKLALEKNNFLILDEPTNHLDIDSKEVLENALIDYQGTILFVSHDRYFINRIATKVIELSENGIETYLGDYDYYLQKKAELTQLRQLKESAENDNDPGETVPTSSMEERTAQKEKQKLQRKLEREIETLEKELAVLEKSIDNIHALLTLPENFAEPEKLEKLNNELIELEEEQTHLLSQWEEKSLSLEDLLEDQ
ncbi:ABC-F family ATP-binding cassette domain-containing protein [Lacticigenium naphthae]|uniref:ABC-F family ATP-binding cassette domain-containing protein n=1 Tax=Lacticigenium naphthae TaxID=515351 RepID=UPI0004152C4C|nr:ABC-F family ATP-binding cassette domain-containing protein [Lacticigenium naphthae]